MPIENNDELKEILKTMASFDVETDFDDEEAKEELVNYFRAIVTADDELVKTFLPKMFGAMKDILVDMNIMEPVGEVETDSEDDLSDLGQEAELTPESLQRMVKPVWDRANDFLM